MNKGFFGCLCIGMHKLVGGRCERCQRGMLEWGHKERRLDLMKTKTVTPLSQSHRTFDAGTNADGSEWMLCDCHGYNLERSVIDGKRSAWVQIIILCDVEDCTKPEMWGGKCRAHS